MNGKGAPSGRQVSERATPGLWYEIKSGDTLSALAARAYGNASRPYYEKIWQANSKAGTDVWDERNDEAGHKIMPGQMIFIPLLDTATAEVKVAEVQAAAATPANKEPVVVLPALGASGGRKHPKGTFIIEIDVETDVGWLGPLECAPYEGRFASGVDIAARAWTGTFRWNPNKSSHFDYRTRSVVASRFNEAVKSGSFARSRCYIDGFLVGTGFLLSRSYSASGDFFSVSCEFYSRTKNLVDSDINPAVTIDVVRNKTLRDIAAKVLPPGYNYVMRWNDEKEFVFNDAPQPGTEKVMTFLQRLAMSRGMFVQDDPYGRVIFHKIPNRAVGIIPSLEFGGESVTEWSATYDDSYIFAEYTAYVLGEHRENDGQANRTLNPTLKPRDKNGRMWGPSERRLIFEAESETGGINDAAEWFVIKSWLDAHSFRLPVSRIYDSNGDLWQEGRIVRVKSPLCENDGWNEMVIRGVEFEFSEDNAAAILSLCPTFYVKDGELQAISKEIIMDKQDIYR
jgi:prophage tail gpP-like protein